MHLIVKERVDRGGVDKKQIAREKKNKIWCRSCRMEKGKGMWQLASEERRWINYMGWKWVNEKKKENTRTNQDLGKIKKGPKLLNCHGARKWCDVWWYTLVQEANNLKGWKMVDWCQSTNIKSKGKQGVCCSSKNDTELAEETSKKKKEWRNDAWCKKRW